MLHIKTDCENMTTLYEHRCSYCDKIKWCICYDCSNPMTNESVETYVCTDCTDKFMKEQFGEDDE